MTITDKGWTELGPGKAQPVWPFFLTVFLSWALWIPAGARAAGVLPFPFPFEIAWIGVFSPLIFSLVFIHRAGGRAALNAFLGRFVKWKFPFAYWAYAFFAIPAAGILTAVGFSVIEGPQFFVAGIDRLLSGEARDSLMTLKYDALNYESAGPFDVLFGRMRDSSSFFIIAFMALAVVDGGLSEEPGWRGYAYPILLERYGALAASLIVGFFWAAWHLAPAQWAILFGQGTEAFLAFLPGYAAAYLMVVMPVAVIYAWLYESSRGSLLICFVMHAVYNISVAGAVILYPERPVMIGVIGFIWLSAIMIVVRRGWRRFGRSA